ncbi:hypothetical protein [Pararhizobium gei]|uniref:hypothetical protein n=1 Tax=Pararhizobium gei TaxID=1395951 RepID=UPI0023DA9EDD|nr:hypothetical protein [Rhizobium gei]
MGRGLRIRIVKSSGTGDISGEFEDAAIVDFVHHCLWPDVFCAFSKDARMIFYRIPEKNTLSPPAPLSDVLSRIICYVVCRRQVRKSEKPPVVWETVPDDPEPLTSANLKAPEPAGGYQT